MPSGYEIVFRSCRLYEADMVADTLQEKGIPFYRQQSNSSGLTLAMPSQPTTSFGVWWDIIVPDVAVPDALNVIRELPVESDPFPAPLDFAGNNTAVKNIWKLYAYAVLLTSLVSILVYVILN